MPTKIIRDPVHDVIALDTGDAVERLIFELIGRPEFQRLRRIRQLGMASLAYPGADHSRYSHSLGVMHTTRLMLKKISQEVAIDTFDYAACLSAALLHDLGHGPFSHVFERVSGVHHESLSHRILLDPASGVHNTLKNFDATLPFRVVELLQGGALPAYLSNCLSSQFDADRLDYLLRDNLMTGSRYGEFDLSWLLQNLVVDPASGRLAITWKGLSAVEAYLQARYHMYRNVYFHKVVRSAEGMVKMALQRAKRLAVQDRLEWPPMDSPVVKILLAQQLTITEFIDLDDVSVLQCFKTWTKSDDATLAAICRGLLYRRLFKTIDLAKFDDGQIANIVERATKLVDDAGGESAYTLFYDAPADTPYKPATEQSAAKEILILDPSGRAEHLADVSPFADGLMRQLTFKRLHVAESWRDRVMEVVKSENVQT
ncbi:MAG: HD domain-containing protein [Tepidisphaeraceae bacterium]